MAYKVLYRKYRPTDFSTLFGQDNIKKLLIDSIINDKLSHAYLFSGPRGTGKTSTAKLFAKTINCEDAKDGIPCGKCQSCINYEQSPDIIEIDAASNNGVDEIRELRENAKVLPTSSKYKIYIIDEVHMLSQSAWNAFLKILEEPPKHIIFILATTELQKIPITIISRCQRFNFQRISEDIIKQNILRIAKKENIKITDEAAAYIANISDGGMRDALSLLDQLSKEKQEINKDLIIQSFGVMTDREVEEIFTNLENNNLEELEILFNEYYNKGLDTNLLISKMINYLYEMEVNYIKTRQSFLSIDDIKQLSTELSNCYNKQDAINLIKINLYSYMTNPSDSKIIYREIIVEPPKEPITENEEKNNKKIEKGLNITDEIKQIRINNSFVGANKSLKESFKKMWQTLINTETDKNNIEFISIIEDVSIEVVGQSNVLFSTKNQSSAILFNESVNVIEEEFNKVHKILYKFICLTNNEWKEEKEKFIKNKNKKYEYINEPEKSGKKSKAVTAASNLFDNIEIEVK